MIYLIGLGLNEKGISLEGLEVVKNCQKVYLEKYTVDFPYKFERLEKIIKKKITTLSRGEVESEKLVNEATKEDIALLIYGCPLFATTHESLLIDCKNKKIKTKVIYSASIFDAISETGLQLYKFGKISTIPKWQKNFEPDSFLDYVLNNKTIEAHSLILVDIGLGFKDALQQLEKSCEKKGIKIEKLIVCSKMGCKNFKIFYGNIEKLKSKKIDSPYCFIIPSKLHFIEKESLEKYSI